MHALRTRVWSLVPVILLNLKPCNWHAAALCAALERSTSSGTHNTTPEDLPFRAPTFQAPRGLYKDMG